MTGDEQLIDQMRADFRTVATDRKALGLWSHDDEIECNNLFKAAIAGKAADHELLQCWAKWLASEAEIIRRLRAMAQGARTAEKAAA